MQSLQTLPVINAYGPIQAGSQDYRQYYSPFSGALGATDLAEVGAALAAKSKELLGLSADSLAAALMAYEGDDRQAVISGYLAAGGNPATLDAAQALLIDVSAAQNPPWYSTTTAKLILGVLGTASMAASAYHGYKRNNSVGWAIWWGLMGSFFPVVTPAIALAQGFGEQK